MTSQSTTDNDFLRHALTLAEGGRGRVSPNPLVGAAIVRDGQVIGEGFHAELGDLHAERAALADCRERGEDPAGAVMYVTLEPCAHQGRQPPCVEAILEAGIGRVVIASDDPSEKAAGRGPGILRDGGVEVAFATGAEATAARRLNQPFRKHARTGLPLVVLKMAMSLDGQTTTAPDDSPWISGPESRELVHRWRAESDAIAVGIGTALTDDPLLTARPAADGTKTGDIGPKSPRQPLRVVFDSQARLPLESQLLKTLDQAPVLVVAAPDAPNDRVSALKDTGAEILLANGLEPALRELGARSITSLFLEGGKTLATSFLSADLIDESRTFVAPMLLGRQPTPPRRVGDVVGGTIPCAVAGDGGSPAAAGPARLPAQESSTEPIGDDVLIKARYKEW
ncbi:MAG TPA: bifunctional diaminohydroxyphosphoribosylaminopyrimidine deaminase/5-amino-6-(5-phosphoribosylamino)uracil reductase RibD [Solirubrobacterales bacterium]|nr:bifunctional diaminohydroxyphosphoribosylaminopyrimidine deaminase/5-amino-6-(5-phosphoribosylamino)uracil reductase RibD [Solirubrobacterales bacterium]